MIPFVDGSEDYITEMSCSSEVYFSPVALKLFFQLV